MENQPNKPDDNWLVTWDTVEEAQLRDNLLLTPAQRLAWAEELMEFAQMAGVAPGSQEKNIGKC